MVHKSDALAPGNKGEQGVGGGEREEGWGFKQKKKIFMDRRREGARAKYLQRNVGVDKWGEGGVRWSE